MSSVHIAHINGLHMSPAHFAAAKDRDLLIREMADELYAGQLGALDLSSPGDVIKYLMFEAPQRYPSGIVTSHMDAAVHLARETIAAAAEGLR